MKKPLLTLITNTGINNKYCRTESCIAQSKSCLITIERGILYSLKKYKKDYVRIVALLESSFEEKESWRR